MDACKQGGRMLRQREPHLPRMGSGGPAGTFAHVDRAALARFLEDLVRGRETACMIILLRFFFVESGGFGENSRLSRRAPT